MDLGQCRRAIGQFVPGDAILSRDEHDLNGPIEVQIVEAVFERSAILFELRVAGQLIETTAEHPFWVVGRGWTPVWELTIGDCLTTMSGETVSVEGVHETARWETVYNLQVAEFHTYFVGCDDWGFSVWTHNKNPSSVHTSGGKWGNPPDPAAADAAFEKLRSAGQKDYGPIAFSDYGPIRIDGSEFGAEDLLLISEKRSREWAGTVGADGKITVIEGYPDSVTPVALTQSPRWLHTHPGQNQVAASAEDVLFTSRNAFKDLDMVIVSRHADGKSVAQLTYTPAEQAKLRSMLKSGPDIKGLDRYSREYVEFLYNKYKAAGYSVEGTDLEIIMRHVGYTPPV